ncbi:helix-turn-helix transcriptional regulator [Flavobacterium sp. J49]|uniref:helix-turn-helix domain-containing protein n=1 Tax=Flavobacterium sp. J49 TaxID=2718534 RepID=UPI0015938F12|nr:response regulator transcription factor [Flavobacterium sp. J49]MBF6640305.1 helix-turn-helix transcriptional regulator [Flavobacterium sp. J49]NIC01550.1 helix-turn-helix transcriptional regulator [Flavobacterium sp. J49]
MNKHHLSEDIESLINSNPNQALKIAQYLLSKTNTTDEEKSRVNFLISKAYKVKGDYSSALNFLFEEKNYEEYLSEEEKISIEINKVILLRELSLDKQAKKILAKLESSLSNIADLQLKSYAEVSIDIEKAHFLLKEGQVKKGIKLLQRQEAISAKMAKDFKELKLYFDITLGQLFLEETDLAASKKYFDYAINMINEQNGDNAYSKIDALYGLASVAFHKKAHKEVINLSEEALVQAKKLNNLFLQVKIMQLQSASYLALNDLANYKSTNVKFFEAQSETEAQEQEAINTTYNLISDEYSDEYAKDKSNYISFLYVVSALFLIIILICLFFWQKTMQRKKGLDEIISYIEITRSNLLESFSVNDKKHEPKKNVILKETEEQILSKLKKFENSKRFINKDISLAVLAGQLDSNTKYLSEIINTHYNVNFNTYINKLRINYIIEKLKTDPNFINYKISYLAENCGFSSHSSFATVFKSITGISPVKFIELLNQEKENNLLEE